MLPNYPYTQTLAKDLGITILMILIFPFLGLGYNETNRNQYNENQFPTVTLPTGEDHSFQVGILCNICILHETTSGKIFKIKKFSYKNCTCVYSFFFLNIQYSLLLRDIIVSLLVGNIQFHD